MYHFLKKYRVLVKPRRGEFPFIEPIDDGEIGRVFKVSCPNQLDAIKIIIGKGILSPLAPRLLFPS